MFVNLTLYLDFTFHLFLMINIIKSRFHCIFLELEQLFENVQKQYKNLSWLASQHQMLNVWMKSMKILTDLNINSFELLVFIFLCINCLLLHNVCRLRIGWSSSFFVEGGVVFQIGLRNDVESGSLADRKELGQEHQNAAAKHRVLGAGQTTQ